MLTGVLILVNESVDILKQHLRNQINHLLTNYFDNAIREYVNRRQTLQFALISFSM